MNCRVASQKALANKSLHLVAILIKAQFVSKILVRTKLLETTNESVIKQL